MISALALVTVAVVVVGGLLLALRTQQRYADLRQDNDALRVTLTRRHRQLKLATDELRTVAALGNENSTTAQGTLDAIKALEDTDPKELP